jgi:hypothetical protein
MIFAHYIQWSAVAKNRHLSEGSSATDSSGGFWGNFRYISEKVPWWPTHFSDMLSSTLIHPRGTIQVSPKLLVQKCGLFGDNPPLTATPYVLTSEVSFSDFVEFVSELEDKHVQITRDNVRGLSLLCDEFRFQAFSRRISKSHKASNLMKSAPMEDSEARMRIAVLEEQVAQLQQAVALLQQSQIPGPRAKASVVRKGRPESGVFADNSASPASPMRILRGLNSSCKMDSSARLSPVALPPISPRGEGESVIHPGLSEVFPEFRGQEFSLLWRGSRDGFSSSAFHRHCDGLANTLTVILDTAGNKFGGFTPIEWDPPVWNGKCGINDNHSKADPSLKSFVFTLVNPRNVPARRFALNAERMQRAIFCHPESGPSFSDIVICDRCNEKAVSYTCLGAVYTNDTNVESEAFFTGSRSFQVKEIEVFRIRANGHQSSSLA